MTMPAKGDVLRRKRDGLLFEVVHVGSAASRHRIQIRRHGATNLKNTNWLSAGTLADRYEPADAPPPPPLAERLRAEFGLPEDAEASASATFGWGWDVGPEGWAQHAVAFARRYPQTKWKWMHVPSNGDWYSLTLFAEIDGVHVEVHGPGGWTQERANLLAAEMKDARADGEGSRTPFPFAYEGAVR